MLCAQPANIPSGQKWMSIADIRTTQQLLGQKQNKKQTEKTSDLNPKEKRRKRKDAKRKIA